MAGHSKWANIQHRKGRQDAKRGKVFTKAAKQLRVFSTGYDNIRHRDSSYHLHILICRIRSATHPSFMRIKVRVQPPSVLLINS